MPGNRIGGLKTKETVKQKYGEDYFKVIGRLGGRNGKTGGFASDKLGPDGLTGRQRASIMGRKGGLISKRRPRES